MIEISVLTVGDLQANCYLVYENAGKNAILFDPGAQAMEILDWAKPYRISHILLTHGHQDHVGALQAVRAELDVPVGIHPADARHFNVPADFYLDEGLELELADEAWLQVVGLPGHTPGSTGFRVKAADSPPLAVVGDAIFPGGPGHTRSHHDLLTALDNLARKVFAWTDDTTLYPGHGLPTTVGAERAAFDEFRRRPLPGSLFGDVTWR